MMKYSRESSWGVTRMGRWGGRASFAILVLAVGAAPAEACNVPVFRFALERWQADSYRVTLVHRGPLAPAEQELLESLEKQQKSAANFELKQVDLDQLKDNADRDQLIARQLPQLPGLVVQYPVPGMQEAPVWKGAWNRESIATLIESPLRKELVRRLADGQTAVWLLLECGDKVKDEAAATLVEQQLKQLEQDLKLPELTDTPADDLLTSQPLRISFSMMRLSQGDAAEKALVDMLVHSEPDLIELREPMVFPVFGRGRALFPLVGAGITAQNVHESAAFLVGPCSCEVKELHPGFDLLLAVDWNSLLFGGDVPPVLAASFSAPSDAPAELVPIPSGSGAAAEPSMAGAVSPSPAETARDAEPAVQGPSQNRSPILAIAGVVGMIVIVVTVGVVTRRKG